MRSDVGKIGLAVLRGLAFHSRFFYRGKLRLQFVRDLLGEIGLNRKDVGQVSIVVARPKMFVGRGIDQLHIYPNAVAGAANATF